MTAADAIRTIRPRQWFKGIFYLLGAAMALDGQTVARLDPVLTGFFAVCLLSSANYVLNDWLDAPFDRFHPVKALRPAARRQGERMPWMRLYIGLLAAGLMVAARVNPALFVTAAVFALSGFLYNVPPARLKDHSGLDIVSDAVTSPLRLVMGWVAADPRGFPPTLLLAGFWTAACFFMAVKRLVELRQAADRSALARYRRSFAGYDEPALLLWARVTAGLTTALVGMYLFILQQTLVPAAAALAVLLFWYLHISTAPDPHQPHLLWRAAATMGMVFLFVYFLS